MGLEFMDNWDCHPMDYNSRNAQHGNHKNHCCSRNQSFSSALLAAICKSTEVKEGIYAYRKSGSHVETRNFKGKHNRVIRISRIERQWDDDPWLNDVKSMRGRSTEMVVFNAEKYEAEAAYISKHREFHLSFQSNMSFAASCSSDYRSDSTSICPYLYSGAEYFYTHTSSILTDKTERNSHPVGHEDRECKWAIGGKCSQDLHGKSLVRDGDFGSTEKPFISTDHHPKLKSKSRTLKDSKKPQQPTSPGRKLTFFLNSLFMAGSIKKPNLSSSSSVSDSNSYDSSEIKPSSIYSSFSSVQSKPCLSKTSRVSNNSSGMRQKSVTFYPTSVIVDKSDSLACGKKCLYRTEKYPAPNPNPSNYLQITHPSTDACKLPSLSEELKLHILEKDRHDTVAATASEDIIGQYQKANGLKEAAVLNRDLDKQDEEEEDDDDASCSSADLFELENLAAIDMSNVYQKTLPVSNPTHLEANKAIANG